MNEIDQTILEAGEKTNMAAVKCGESLKGFKRQEIS